MLHINLDNLLASAIEGIGPAKDLYFFPGGEPFMKLPDFMDSDRVFITAPIRSWDDWGKLVSLCDALYHQDVKMVVFCPYFPGARQDRNPGGNTPLSVDLYAHQLSRYVSHLVVFDCHSDGALTILRSHFKIVHAIQAATLPFDSLPRNVDYILIPDKGAVERAEAMQEKHFRTSKLIQCDKVRDFSSGKLDHGFSINGVNQVISGRFLVVDDICDGGATFNALAQAWEKHVKIDSSASELLLYVSHGIFSSGLENIDDAYEHIYTTDSWCCIHPAVDDRLTVIKLDWITEAYLAPASAFAPR